MHKPYQLSNGDPFSNPHCYSLILDQSSIKIHYNLFSSHSSTDKNAEVVKLDIMRFMSEVQTPVLPLVCKFIMILSFHLSIKKYSAISLPCFLISISNLPCVKTTLFSFDTSLYTTHFAVKKNKITPDSRLKIWFINSNFRYIYVKIFIFKIFIFILKKF
jgi:hypothetical protein